MRTRYSHVKTRVWNAVNRPASDIAPADMEWIGINNLMRVARLLNACRGGTYRSQRFRRRLYRTRAADIFAANGAPLTEHGAMRDGFLHDTTRTWPHLQEMISQAEQVIADHGMTRVGVDHRRWIRDIMTPAYVHSLPAFVDFISSTDVMKICCEYLKLVPSLSATVPPGVRLTESFTEPGEVGGPYKTSQLYHIDIHATPMIYVIVLVRDTGPDHGPFHYIGAGASRRLAQAIGHGKRGRPFRVTDERVHRHVKKDEVRVFTGKAGDVLFIDSTRCFHMGSRDATTPRYQVMFTLTPPIRSDFTEWYMAGQRFPLNQEDSLLRQLVLNSRQ